MKENFTSINVVMDMSGSMATLTSDTIGGFNKFLLDQKAFPGEAVFTLCTFNDDYRLVHDFVKIANVQDLDESAYKPAGYTALLDALGTTINSVGTKLSAMEESERPSKVIFLIMTDGQENSSSKFTREKIRDMVKHQQDVYNWEFVFIGANMDAFSEGTSLGFTGSNSVSYSASSLGTQDAYKSISDNMTSYRGSAQSRVDFFDQGNSKPDANLTPKNIDLNIPNLDALKNKVKIRSKSKK